MLAEPEAKSRLDGKQEVGKHRSRACWKQDLMGNSGKFLTAGLMRAGCTSSNIK